ncbi:spo12 family protein [Cladophialophora carrionii]|uniref:Spo12 family protein n=1 Tax=Cladophialophora carrionii TaxID=86049 RepID=A0A1C1D2T3_9EURO|nr:spo12 family protein [Cladophialophora carrionii]
MSPTKDTSSGGPLAEKSPNTFSPTKATSSGKLSPLDQKTAMPRFEPPQIRACTQTADQSGASQTYISPSDAIRSPTTKKLSEIKGKRFKNAKPKTLFAQTVFRENIKAQSHESDASSKQE